MILEPGTRLGPYEIGVLAGSGGMGDVYRARDTRLNRDVAVKVLPSNVATSAVRRARFEREARAISRLNHAHICTVYDVGEDEGVAFIVMEYIEGQSLERRLLVGPMPVGEALDASIQIASALCAAHEQGVVHRDLKPANVMLAPGGIKLLDFGIAKLLDEDPPAGGDAIAPTITLTAEHAIVGTVSYMAPEQLEGREVDQRADLFAFGALLYEMLTGRKAFAGSSGASIAAAVLTADPPAFSALLPEPAAIPRGLDHILRRALAKQPEERWQTARDLMLELRSIRNDSLPEIASVLEPRRVWRRRLPLVLATLAVAGAAALLAWDVSSRAQGNGGGPLTLLTIGAPDGTRLEPGYGSVAVAPDGLKIAFVAVGPESRSIWIRYLNSAVPQRLLGSEGAIGPFWSPDSRVVGFYDGMRRLSRIAINGGRPEVIADGAGTMPAACWLPDTSIVFNRNAELMRVPAGGGTAEPFSAPDERRNERAFWFPSSLPDGRVLFTVRGAQLNSGSRIRAASGPGETDLPSVGSNAAYAAGHLIFRQGPALVAQRFDPRTAKFGGQPIALAYGVLFNPASGRTVFSASDDVIAYRAEAPGRLTWMDRSGRRTGSVGDEGRDWNPVMATDGSNRIAFDRFDAGTGGFQVWTMDDQGRAAAFTHGVKERFGIWSPDGQWIAYTSPTAKGGEMRRRATAGADRDEFLTHTESDILGAPLDWTRDGRFIVYSTGGDLWMLPLAEPRTPVQLTSTPAIERVGRVSPDSKWIAYSSVDKEQRTVWVQPFSAGSQSQRILLGEGFDPSWRQDGKELYYLSVDGSLMSVAVTSAAPLTFGPPVALFSIPLAQANFALHLYAAAPDGQRFLVSEPVQTDPPITVMVHWATLVRQ